MIVDRPSAAARGRQVVHVYKDYPPVMGGIEAHLGLVARAQAGAGWRVTVLVTEPGGRGSIRVEDGVTVIRARRLATVASTPLSLALPAALARLRADIFHLHCPYPVGELAWLAVGRRPMVVTWHSDVVRQKLLGALWAPGQRALLRRADRVLATSANYARTSPFLQALPPDKLRILPLGIAAPGSPPDPAAARARFGEGPTLAFVGQLRYYKGLGVLLDALSALRAAGGPRPRLLVVGRGPMEAEWRARAAAGGLDDQVHWLGDAADAERDLVLAAADLFVLPAVARSEAFGLVLLEAMAAGLPLVTTELGTGTSWVNQHRETGLVVPAGDAAALAAALELLLGDADLRRTMGARARQRFEAQFTAERMLADLDRIYEEVLACGS